MSFTVRDATAEDFEAMAAIHNHEILHGVAHWNTSTQSAEDMGHWVENRRVDGFPVLVAGERAAPAGSPDLLGYASFGPFRPHAAYARTVEHSVYVTPTARRRGVGRALLEGLIARAHAADMHAMIGGIEAGNAASLALHRALGFEEVGRLPEVGRKFDRWLTLVFLQRLL